MKTIEPNNIRVISTLSVVLILLAGFVPANAAVEPFQSSDFNRCDFAGVWSPGGATTATLSGAYTGESVAVLTVPPGQDLTFSGKNKLAPRIMQATTDTSFEVEVKFNSPLGQTPTDTYNIQGLLFYDTQSVPGKTKTLRFDVNSNGSNLNYYIGYFNENGSLTGIVSKKNVGTDVTTGPIYLRVKYDQPSGTWYFGYKLNDPSSFTYQYQFTETAAPNVTGGFTFNVTNAGVFAASTSNSTSSTAPGIVSKVDYFKSLTNTAFTDDTIKLTVQTVGSGNVTQQCAGDIVTLTAAADPGATFTGWSGDVTDTQPTINLTMNQSYDVTATFGGQATELPFKTYFPTIQH